MSMDKEVRGMGAMIGIEIINDKTGEPDKEEQIEYINKLLGMV